MPLWRFLVCSSGLFVSLYVVWISMIRLPFGFRLYFWCRYMLLNLMPWFGLKICLFIMFLLQYHLVQPILADSGGFLLFALRSTSVDLEITWLLNCHVYAFCWHFRLNTYMKLCAGSVLGPFLICPLALIKRCQQPDFVSLSGTYTNIFWTLRSGNTVLFSHYRAIRAFAGGR